MPASSQPGLALAAMTRNGPGVILDAGGRSTAMSLPVRGTRRPLALASLLVGLGHAVLDPCVRPS